MGDRVGPISLAPPAMTQRVLLERYHGVLRTAWNVGWAAARNGYLHQSADDQDELLREVAEFDQLYSVQTRAGFDPVVELRQRDLCAFVTRPLAVVAAFGVAALSAAIGLDGVTSVLNAGLTFGLADSAARAFVRATVR